jgi:positive regulator of sigma E activity
MILIYICVGIFLILSNIAVIGFSEFNNRLFGILLLIYGVYRGYVFWRKYLKKIDEEGEQ